MAIRMQQRRGTASQWTSANPTLAAGEIGFETDTGKFKIGDGTTAWASLHYFTDANSILGGISGVDLPATLDTLNELAAAMNDDPNFFSTIATNLSNHENDTTNIHGIADTSALATKTYADSAVSTHSSDTTGVHGISDTSALATKSGAEVFTNKTISYADNTITVQVNNISDLTASAAELNKLDGVTASTSEINTLVGITASSTELNILDGATLSTTELNYVDGVTSAIQAQIDAKAPLASPTFTGTVTLPSGTVTSTMIADGTIVNDDINSAAAIDKTKISGTAITAGDTGTVTSTMIADGTIVNADINASAAIAQSKIANLTSDLALKAPLASPTFTGTLTAADATITGNLTVTGTTTTVGTTNLNVSDPMIYMGADNAGNSVDLGIVSSFNDGTYQHSGLVRDASDSKWKLFKGVTDEPTTTINFTQGSLDALAVGAFEASSITVGNVSNTEFGYLDGVTSAIQTQINAKAPSASPTFTGTVTLPSDTSIGNVTSTEIGYIDGVTSAIQTQIDAKTPELYTFTSDATTARTLALTDKFKSLKFTSASATTVTIPTNASVAFPIGSYIELYQWGAGQVSVVAATPATTSIRSTDSQVKLRTQYSSAVLIKVDTDEWLLTGDLTA